MVAVVHGREVLDVARQQLSVPGEYWEVGVYRGGCAQYLARLLASHQPRVLRLFDTFAGRPEKGPHDMGWSQTPFTDTSEALVRARVPEPFVSWHVGLVPETFAGLEHASIAFAYVDLDLYQSTADALAFITPRLSVGGVALIDDYDAPQDWPGVRAAVEAGGYAVELYGSRALLWGNR